ncbi:hypothetical protein KIV40_16865 [Vibrio sp. D173a]|uniref:RHS repeat-associated core domain-containing protein n=1 Tax=Vibrio sp. D173a TaxID=2836349 RepID=UPI002555218A|nr:RHS repeat-associated core domain-containing protein [Vibrio sp. D173a]MDK9757033.1 hypothetical protein [Vibrio sp. D173a]
MLQEYAWDKSAPGGIGGLLVAKTSSDIYTYVYNHLGHVQKVLNASGQVVESYQYTPYGQVEGGDFSQQPFGYSTKRSDFESGLVYFGYRFYSPYQRRWLNRDPLQEQGGINLYAYVNGDPLGYVDPDGRNAVARLVKLAKQFIKKSKDTGAPNKAAKPTKKAKPEKCSGVTNKTGKGLGNPFKDKTAKEIDEMFTDKGFEKRGPDPANGTGGYVNPKTGRSYHIDPKEWGKYPEPNHVDVNRLKSYDGALDKKKLPYKE